MAKKTKKIDISLSLEVPVDATPEMIAVQMEKLLTGIHTSEEKNVKPIKEFNVRFAEKQKIDVAVPPPSGYEARIWEKATCCAVKDIRDQVTNPNPIEEKIKIIESIKIKINNKQL